MKTIPIIEKEIKEIVNSTYDTDYQMNKAGKRAALLRQCIKYLETNPKEKFIKEQLEYCDKKIKVIEDGYETWLRNTDVSEIKNTKTAYATMMGKKEVVFQIKALNYLLS